MLKYFLLPTIGALSGSHLYLIMKGLYDKNIKYGIYHHYIYSNNKFILNSGFILGGLLGCTYLYLDEPIFNYFLRK